MVTKGQKINERYEVIRSIGEGGMANVYLGYDTILDRNVAIKILRGDLSNDEKFVRRFQREALSASSLSHPTIVEMYDVGEDDGLYYIVMEYIEGKTLKQLLKRRGSLTLSETLDIMLQLTDGMAHAHDSYIIHRDLKPQNIMIQDDGQIKITDFGIAMALNSTQLTQTNSVMGSVHYLPPEQASGKGSTVKSDIYSMGIICYELLSGTLPFRGENAVEIALKHMKESLPSLREENSQVPQSIENIIMRSTAKNPKNRYDSAKAMYEDLLTALNDERMHEEPHVYLYPEQELDVSKNLKKLEESEEEEEVIASKIEDKKEKKKKKLIIILASIFVVILISLLSVFFIFSNSDPATVEIPDVAEMTLEDAIEALEEAGLTVSEGVEELPSEDIEEGLIIRTDPPIGRRVARDREITLFQSTGPETFEIEDFTGQNYIRVQTLLEDQLGLIVTIATRDATGTGPVDQQAIIGQSIEAGTRVRRGDSITLFVPNAPEVFPNMRELNWTSNDAEAFALTHGLTLNVNYQDTTAYEEGQIISQRNTPGTNIVRGATLTITVARRPAQTAPGVTPGAPIDSGEESTD